MNKPPDPAPLHHSVIFPCDFLTGLCGFSKGLLIPAPLPCPEWFSSDHHDLVWWSISPRPVLQWLLSLPQSGNLPARHLVALILLSLPVAPVFCGFSNCSASLVRLDWYLCNHHDLAWLSTHCTALEVCCAILLPDGYLLGLPIDTSYHRRYGLVLSRLGYCSSPWLRSGAFLGTARLSSLLTVPFAAPSRQRYGFDLSCRWSYPSVWLPSASPDSPSAAIPRRSPLLYEGMTAPFPSDLRSCPLPSPRSVHWSCISFVY